MKQKCILLFILFVAISITTNAQQNKSFKFGFELDGKMKKVDSGTQFDSPIGVARFGAFGELSLSNHFSGRLKAGLNNMYLHQDAIDFASGEHFKELNVFTQSIEISLEPVYYFFSTEQFRKVNIFASLPIIFETKSLGKDYIFRTKFSFVPTIGCRYDFTEHWGVEASGGLGWRKYGKYEISSLKSSEMEYSLSIGLKYTF